jgi:H2-forming N5,N10-methylenetetrahydromethanopterin dehydrogenase-like enzyme
MEKLMQVTSKDVRLELIKQNEKIIDEQFFALFSRIAQNAMQSGQEPMARALIEIQTQLLEETAYGRQLKESVAEMEAAQQVLQDAGQSLNREKLLDFVIEAQNLMPASAHMSHGARRHGLYLLPEFDRAHRESLR